MISLLSAKSLRLTLFQYLKSTLPVQLPVDISEYLSNSVTVLYLRLMKSWRQTVTWYNTMR